jgi:hypothetical protein
MAFANANVSDIVATTIQLRSKSLANNIVGSNALLTNINKSGNIRTVSGGSEIIESIISAENGNAGSYSGYDTLPTAAQDVISGAQYVISQYACPVTFSGRDKLLNAGSSAVIDMIEGRVKAAEITLKNVMNRHLYLDGTGNNGKNLLGLAAAVPLAATNVYGGIDRNTAIGAFWKNQTLTASVTGTSSTIQGYLNTILLSCTFGSERPNIIISAPTSYAILQASLQSIQRISSSDTANAGFQTISYAGIPVYYENVASGITDQYMYLLNTNYFHFRPHADCNFIALDPKTSVNQDATVKTIAWAGQLTVSGSRYQGLYKNSQ